MFRKRIASVLIVVLILTLSVTLVSAIHSHNYVIIGGNSYNSYSSHPFTADLGGGVKIPMVCDVTTTYWSAAYKCTICASSYVDSGTSYYHANPYCPSH